VDVNAGAALFDIEAPAAIEVVRCNCSICTMSGFLTLFVLKNNFRLLKDDDAITTYTFNSGVAQHFFVSIAALNPTIFRVRILMVLLSRLIALSWNPSRESKKQLLMVRTGSKKSRSCRR
jgi:hypothetical protein